jgi:hypothetical protein
MEQQTETSYFMTSASTTTHETNHFSMTMTTTKCPTHKHRKGFVKKVNNKKGKFGKGVTTL